MWHRAHPKAWGGGRPPGKCGVHACRVPTFCDAQIWPGARDVSIGGVSNAALQLSGAGGATVMTSCCVASSPLLSTTYKVMVPGAQMSMHGIETAGAEPPHTARHAWTVCSARGVVRPSWHGQAKKAPARLHMPHAAAWPALITTTCSQLKGLVAPVVLTLSWLLPSVVMLMASPVRVPINPRLSAQSIDQVDWQPPPGQSVPLLLSMAVAPNGTVIAVAPLLITGVGGAGDGDGEGLGDGDGDGLALLLLLPGTTANEMVSLTS